MPELNPVSFVYEPVCGDLYLDRFRSGFYTERLDDVADTLQYLTLTTDTVASIEGEIRFSDADGEPPQLRDLRYHDPEQRAANDDPFPDPTVDLWPDDQHATVE